MPKKINTWTEIEGKKNKTSKTSLKEGFFDYIGPKGSLNNSKYQKTYKLMLLLHLFILADSEGKADYDMVCKSICQMYLARYRKGLLIEEKDSPIQREAEQLNKDIIKRVMNDNAYKVIHDKGYINKKTLENVEYIHFDKVLWGVLNKEDIQALKETLKNKLEIYYKERVDNQESTMQEEFLMDAEIKYTSKGYIEHIYNYINSQGFYYDIDTIKNFYLSLKTKPFVLLAGISGTGKSKLVELFAEAIGATSENGRYNIIPVRPDWSDPSDLLGYKNIDGKFQAGPLTNIVKEAVSNLDMPYFVCLDEMNLARVEYYFSDILSLMETRKRKNGIKTDKLLNMEIFGEDEVAKKDFADLYIPENLYIIGTVNMDETTFPFSRKVLDRGNTIEFNHVDLSLGIGMLDKIEETKPIFMNNEILSSKYLKLKDCLNYQEIIKETIIILEQINNILEEVGLHFGYRVRDEIIFYIIYGINEKLMQFDEGIDYGIIQKILPRIQGSNQNIKEILIKLYKYLSNDKSKEYDPYRHENFKKMYIYLNQHKVKYPLASKKIVKMIRRYESDGFTTFWE
ncbi:AAA family ATPase [Clostridiaceae bacterium 35-E11]